MPKRDYPDQIDLKVEDRVQRGDSGAFNTTDQQQAAHQLIEHWPIQFTELADEYDYTDGFYRQVLNRYFGPAESDITFEEIWEEYGTLKIFLERHEQANGTSEAYERGYDSGFEAGYEKGFEQAKKQYADE